MKAIAPGNLYTNQNFWREEDGVIVPTAGALADLLELNAEQDDALNLILRKESGSDGPFYWNGKGFTLHKVRPLAARLDAGEPCGEGQ